MSESSGVKIQSLERAFEILRLFKKHDEIGISEIAQSVNLSKSTAFGLVNTLVKIGFLEKDADSKKYRLGMELFELGTLVEKRMNIKKQHSHIALCFRKNTALRFIWLPIKTVKFYT